MVDRKEFTLIKTDQRANIKNIRPDEDNRLQIWKCSSKEKHREHKQSKDNNRNLRGTKEIQEHKPNHCPFTSLRLIIPALNQDKNPLLRRHRNVMRRRDRLTKNRHRKVDHRRLPGHGCLAGLKACCLQVPRVDKEA